MTSGYADIVFAAIKTLQVALVLLQDDLQPVDFLCPTSATIDTINSHGPFEYIVVGGGTAGSVMATNLAKTNASVLLLEAGGCPPIESLMSGLFPTLPLSRYDHQYDMVNDGYSCQNLKSQGILTAGKMLGGSGALDHMMYLKPYNEDDWITAANDTFWSMNEFRKYFKKGESPSVCDRKALNSSQDLSGPALVTRQTSEPDPRVIAALTEMGFNYAYDADTEPFNVNKPLFNTGNYLRQSGVVPYLYSVKDRQNLYVRTNATVKKINFENMVATGVQFNHKGVTYSVNATKKVILSTGAIATPSVLMLSGIGKKSVLTELGITPVLDIEDVGQNLVDNPAIFIGFALDKNTTSPAASDPTFFPLPSLITFPMNDNETVITTVDIGLQFPANSQAAFLQLCTVVFKYKHHICDEFYKWNIDRNLYLFVSTLSYPNSKGYVIPKTANIEDKPTVGLNYLRDSSDLEKFAVHAMSLAAMVNTTAFKALGAEIAYLDDNVCQNETKNTLEYWKCYALAMTSPTWHFCGTCAMGKVVNSKLEIPGISNFKIVDGSVMPSMTVSKVGAAIRAMAEKMSLEIIKEDGCTYNISV